MQRVFNTALTRLFPLYLAASGCLVVLRHVNHRFDFPVAAFLLGAAGLTGWFARWLAACINATEDHSTAMLLAALVAERPADDQRPRLRGVR